MMSVLLGMIVWIEMRWMLTFGKSADCEKDTPHKHTLN